MFFRKSLLLSDGSSRWRAVFLRFICNQPAVNRLYRSWYFTSNPDHCLSSSQPRADVVVLDMEDGTPVHLKTSTRREIAKMLNSDASKHPRLFVRLNPLENQHELLKDLSSLVLPPVAGFVLPKVQDSLSLREFDKLIAAAERRIGLSEGSRKLVPIMETTNAFFQAESIAKGSRRVIGLLTGMADFKAECHCDESSPTYFTFLSHVVMACRAADVLPVAGVCEKLDDHIAAERFYSQMKACGFVGSAVLTPTQVVHANISYSPSTQEAKWASEVLKGSVSKELDSGTYIGPMHLKKASEIHRHSCSESARVATGLLSPRGCMRPQRHNLKIGDVRQAAREETVTDSWLNAWRCSIPSDDRITSSAEFAVKVGLPSVSFPFSFLNALAFGYANNCLSASKSSHVGCYDSVQINPLFPGDTVSCFFHVTDVNPSSAHSGTVVHSNHRLVNQHDQTVFATHVITSCPGIFTSPEEKGQPDQSRDHPQEPRDHSDKPHGHSHWRTYILSQAPLALSPILTQPPLAQGDLITHEGFKVFGFSEVKMLATLLRITSRSRHASPSHFSAADYLVPAPLVVAATVSNTVDDLGEVLYEEFPAQTNINDVNPGDRISTATYVVSVRAIIENPDLEEVKLVHIGIKNADLSMIEGFPAEIFTDDFTDPAQNEEIYIEYLPSLYRRIVCRVVRNVVRYRDRYEGFSGKNKY